MARPSAGFAPAGMLRARTRPPSISSVSGGRRRRRPGMGRTASASSSGASSPICIDRDSSDSGGGGQNTLATCGWSNSERKTEMPSTMDVRILGSSASQSFRYQRSMASTCSLSSRPAPPSLSSVSYAISSSASRSRSTGSSRHITLPSPEAGLQTQSFSASGRAIRSLREITACAGHAAATRYWASRIFSAKSPGSIVQR